MNLCRLLRIIAGSPGNKVTDGGLIGAWQQLTTVHSSQTTKGLSRFPTWGEHGPYTTVQAETEN